MSFVANRRQQASCAKRGPAARGRGTHSEYVKVIIYINKYA